MDDQWETQVIEYGAINITGFRIVDHSRRYVRDFLDGWRRLDASSSKGAGKDSISVRCMHIMLMISPSSHSNRLLQAQAALMYDAVFVLVDAFTKLLKKKPDQFRTNVPKKVTGHVAGTSNNATGNGGLTFNLNANIHRGVECNITKTMIDAWEHGDKISRYLRKVQLFYLCTLIMLLFYIVSVLRS